MAVNRPSTLKELVEFYRDVFLPLYDSFQVQKAVPQELNAEIAAALDHLISSLTGDERDPFPPDAIRAAAGHLKRATFDGFKVLFDQEIRRPREEFCSDRYADVHDGQFRQEVSELWADARKTMLEARKLERTSRIPELERWDAAFEKWRAIEPFAEQFAAFESDRGVVRAKGRTRIQKIVSVVWALILVVLGAVLSHYFPALLELLGFDSAGG